MRITASQIVEWANTKAKEAQTALPRLIRRLCFEAATTRQISFPAGDSTYLPGWDGFLVRERGDAWTPAGTSCWEIGCDKDATRKANKEYQKRTRETDPADRASTTFVFVTPRRWATKKRWIAARRAAGDWADVRAYDADDLEQWLEQATAVAIQFAEELGAAGEGVESLSRYWATWSQQCGPAITPEALLLDRIPIRDQLTAKIREEQSQGSSSSFINVRADSVEEAAAFAVATLMEIDEFAHQALVVTSAGGWRLIEANPQLRVAIAARTEVAIAPTQRAGLLVIVPQAAGDTTAQLHGVEVLLERPNIYEFEKALVSIGMEESDAKRYAITTGRSWTVFRRQRATNAAIRHPIWLDAQQAACLSLLCLLGAWNSDREADRQIVERLADRPYDDVERELQQLAQCDDAPLLRIGAVWKAKSPLELLSLFGGRISRSELDRFFAIARDMLVMPDPQLELPQEQRFAAAVYGKVHPHSSILFESICDGLVKLAVRGPEQSGLHALQIEARVGRFVHELLDDATETRWLSLASHLRTLAEAAPTEFLNAVEKSLRLPNAPVTRLLTESNAAGVNGRCWHAGLLWALETLAWAPSQLARVALILAQLTHVSIQGNWGNTPGRSLFGIFRSWLPQTAAGLQDRIQVLDLLIRKDANVAFDILEGLTASGQQMAMYAARPKWREDDAGAGRGVTYAERHEMNAAARERILQLSAGNAPRIAILLQNTRKEAHEEVFEVLALMEPFALPTATDEDREILRCALRTTIHWHRNYNDAPAAKLDAWLPSVERTYEQLAPIDLIQRYCWLFSSHWVQLPAREREDPVQARHDALRSARVDALTCILEELGIAGVDALISKCAEPGTVGATLAEMNDVGVQWSNWFIEKGGSFRQDAKMTWCISGFLRATSLPQSAELLREVMTQGDQHAWDAERRARFLILAKPERATWQLVEDCGAGVDAAYWATMRPDAFLYTQDADLMFALHRLMDAKRPRTALQCCQYSPERVEAQLLYSLLNQFLAGNELDGPRIDSWHLGEMLERLEQSGGIEKTPLIQLEFGLFPALGYGQEVRAAALYEGVMSEPVLFTELICLLFKPEHGQREDPVTDASRAAAETAWQILHGCKRLPGTQANGSIDPTAFALFIDTARELCREADRLTMCEQTLGQILAYAPADDDGTWPFLPAREILDRAEMAEMRTGFVIGTHNKRGVTRRSPWDGGDQERDLSIYFRGQAQRVQYTHTSVATMLEDIAKDYEREGNREDVGASLRKEGY